MPPLTLSGHGGKPETPTDDSRKCQKWHARPTRVFPPRAAPRVGGGLLHSSSVSHIPSHLLPSSPLSRLPFPLQCPNGVAGTDLAVGVPAAAGGDDRPRAGAAHPLTFLLHLRPVRLPAATLRWTHTFGLGGSSLVLVALLAATGILMMLVYQPVPDAAYDSVVAHRARRRLRHRWCAASTTGAPTCSSWCVLLHLARVFLTGGYHGAAPVQLGDRLRPAGRRAGRDLHRLPAAVGPARLLGGHHLDRHAGLRAARRRRGCSVSCAAAPRSAPTRCRPSTRSTPRSCRSLLVVLMAFHFWRVRKAGGVVVPPPRPDEPTEDAPREGAVPAPPAAARGRPGAGGASRWWWCSALPSARRSAPAPTPA